MSAAPAVIPAASLTRSARLRAPRRRHPVAGTRDNAAILGTATIAARNPRRRAGSGTCLAGHGVRMSLRSRLQHRNSTLIGLALVGLLLVLTYRDTLALLTAYWASNDMYSYGFLVPVISALMFWARRDELPTTRVPPSLLAGGLVVVAGLTALQFGRASATNLIQEMSFVVTVAGLTLLLLGWAFLKRFWFPVAYLLAMIPFWDFLTRGVQPFFQVYSAAIGVSLLGLFGVPVFRHGFFIDLPNVRLEVAEACSGINHLVAVMCIGVPATLLLIRSWKRRLLILASAVGIALASNGVRVAVVCMFAYHGLRAANGDIHGPYALFRSLLISGVGFLVLFALILYFADKETPWRPTRHAAPSGQGHDASAAFGIVPWAFILAALLLCSSLGIQQWHRTISVPPNLNLASFPMTVGGWRSTGSAEFGAAFEAIRFDDRLSRDYANSDADELNLRIGTFGTRRRGRSWRVGTWPRSSPPARSQTPWSIAAGCARRRTSTTLPPGGRTSRTGTWWEEGRSTKTTR